MNKATTIYPIKQTFGWSTYEALTVFERMCGIKGTHIPTEEPRTYIGIKGEIMIDDEVPRDKPYAKIGDGTNSFDGLAYIEKVKDYYAE